MPTLMKDGKRGLKPRLNNRKKEVKAMCKITMIENGAIVEIETLEQMAKEITRESESYLIVNEEGTILDSKNVSRLIDEIKQKPE